eukprot:TRINITY_DN1036_c0_g1_i5.p1 TRINITY_DN1036_c0_g1~~TRINITY_DN1036_c0_g1_i5.p1  ORF type:complete len:501 (+),score=156.13 TRINITY_DN1036_c0_g1_i5:218-1504(+)
MTAIPEFSVYAKRIRNATVSLTLQQTKGLLEGSLALTSATNLGNFQMQAASGGIATIAATYNITVAVATHLVYYIRSVTTDFVNPKLAACYAIGGGLIATRTAEEWLFGTNHGAVYYDPFLALLGVSSQRKFFFNDTIDGAIAHGIRFGRFTGKDDISKVAQLRERNNQTHWAWATPVAINGTDGTRYEPLFDAVADVGARPTLPMWNEDFRRPVTLAFVRMETIRGADVAVYTSVTENRAVNPQFWNYVRGFVNFTSLYANTPMFGTWAHFTGVGSEDWISNFTADSEFEPDVEKYTSYFYVDPFSGLVVGVKLMSQVNIYLSPSSAALFTSATNSKVQRNTFYPLFWFNKTQMMTEAQAGKVKLLPALIKGGTVSLAVLLTVGLAALLVGLVAVAVFLSGTRTIVLDDPPAANAPHSFGPAGEFLG